LLCGCAVLLVAVPLTRSSELNEISSQRERNEESSYANRVDNEKHLRLSHGFTTFVQLARPLLGHAQRCVLAPPSGHRLLNGLLAPITC
jgi:hypothetical protein